MKSTIRTIAMLAIVAGLASCQEKNNPDGNDIGTSEAKLGKVCLTVNIAPPTKVTYAESGTDLQPSWVGDETVILVAEGKTYPLTVKLVGNDATLEGEALKPCTGSLIYYKNAASVTKDADFSDITVDYTNQTGNAEASVFIAKDVAISADGTGEGTLSNAGAIIGITNAKGIPVGAKISKVIVSGAKLSKATVGSGAAFSVANDAAGTLEITPASAPTVGSDNSISPIYIAVPAGESTRIQEITLHTDKGDWSIVGSTAVRSGDYLYVKTNLFGALPGKFSVEEGKRVYFSQGNLKYDKGTDWTDGTWCFFDNQYDYDPGTNDTCAADYISLFTWGYKATNSINPEDDSSDNSSVTNDGDSFFKTEDWGSQVGDGNTWRTLTTAEWQYLFGDSDERKSMYACGVEVNGAANCVVLYPDGYSKEKVVKNKDVSSYNTEEKYLAATAEGVVFLPPAGLRDGSFAFIGGPSGYYWSSTAFDEDNAYYLDFDGEDVCPESGNYRYFGVSVRLVSDCN